MDGHGIGLIFHQTQRKVICCQCGAAWEERFIGVRHFNCYGRKCDGETAICPRCVVMPLTVSFLIEHEIALALSSSDDFSSAEIRRHVTERYGQFLR